MLEQWYWYITSTNAAHWNRQVELWWDFEVLGNIAAHVATNCYDAGTLDVLDFEEVLHRAAVLRTCTSSMVDTVFMLG